MTTGLVPANGRIGAGRFGPGNQAAKGNRGGPGRPPREVEKRYLQIMKEVVTEQDWKEVCEMARDQAKMGDNDARNFLAYYMIGKPTQVIQIQPPNTEPLAFLPPVTEVQPDASGAISVPIPQPAPEPDILEGEFYAVDPESRATDAGA